jgi:hypothetical protein
MLPDQTRPFQIESNASKYASGAVLMQTDINGIDILAPICQKLSHPLNEITKFMIENSWASFVLYANGDITFRDRPMKQSFILITRALLTSEILKN